MREICAIAFRLEKNYFSLFHSEKVYSVYPTKNDRVDTMLIPRSSANELSWY